MLAIACAPRPTTPAGQYRSYCARCHGDDGRGNPRHRGVQEKLDLGDSAMVRGRDLAAVSERIATGKGTMPGFAKQLTAAELEALAAHTCEVVASASPP